MSLVCVFRPPSISIISLVLTDLTHMSALSTMTWSKMTSLASAVPVTIRIRFYGAKFERSAGYEGLNKTKARNDGNAN